MYTPELWSLRDILALSYIRGIHGSMIRQVVHASPSLEECLDSPPTASFRRIAQQSLFAEQSVQTLRDQADRQLQRCERHQTRVLSIYSVEYPSILKTIAYPPVLLFVRGNLPNDNEKGLAIVGTRNCTSYGRSVAESFARVCSDAGIRVNSGLALGIDSSAHAAALKGIGGTTAVIACGTDCTGPQQTRQLAHEILNAGGALISEYRCGTRAIPPYFPQRDRIISGISRAVLVIESGLRGGSLITAEFAVDQGRDLFAVPGPITSEQSAGCNHLLLRRLARPILSADQLLQELGYGKAPQATEPAIDFSSELEEKIYTALSTDTKHADVLADELGASANELLVALLNLEFKGLVKQSAGKLFQRSVL